jgi:uncharacterized protein (DUF2141 family)
MALKGTLAGNLMERLSVAAFHSDWLWPGNTGVKTPRHRLQTARRLIGRIVQGCVGAFAVLGCAQAGDLELTVAGIRSDKGALMIGLYDSPAKFTAATSQASSVALLSDKGRFVGVTMRASPGSLGIGFLQLPPGRYAIIVFHDENDNGLLDSNFFGLPTEGYGFSNDAAGFFGAPSFDAASVTVGSADRAIVISLTY